MVASHVDGYSNLDGFLLRDLTLILLIDGICKQSDKILGQGNPVILGDLNQLLRGRLPGDDAAAFNEREFFSL